MDLVESALQLARLQVQNLDRHECTTERFRQIAEQTARMLVSGEAILVEEIVRKLEEDYDVFTPQPVVLEDPDRHVPWLDDRRRGINFAHWRRFEEWLKKKGRKPASLASLGETTDRVLGLLEDPYRPGPWRNHGMVFGQVQSGKTANYTGVICKAVDAGYRVVVVLTSQHESLRHQTQARLDTEFLGFNSRFTRDPDADHSKWVGVGTLNMKAPSVLPITTQDGDFTASQFKGTSVDIHQMNVLAVVKKNARILRNLRDWLRNQLPPGAEHISNAPLLLIDDEADYGSVDTKRPRNGDYNDPEHDPTAINTCVRELLGLFDQSAYLAYTATPFANIFINGETDHPLYGKDLFPRDFIVALEPSSDYCGPEVVFGLRDDSSGTDGRDPLPTIRAVADHEQWMPDRHRKGFQVNSPLPASLVEALDAFILSTAVRRHREILKNEQQSHNTMLVHVTRFTDVQGEVARQLEEHLNSMVEAWGDYGHSGRRLRERLADLWHRDFEKTHTEMAGRDDVTSQVGPRVSWNDITAYVPDVLEEAASGVKRINGKAEDILEYELATPATVVAVGGDKLSRGLTLEGLTVSYYLRASRTYDTLLQMGRWFGYRPGYLDVTRLYTTDELLSSYVHITRANRELMDLSAVMSRSGQKPGNVGMRVLEGTGSLRVTAAAKMRSSETLTVSLAGERAETLRLLIDTASQTTNMETLQRLIEHVERFHVDRGEAEKAEVSVLNKGLLFKDAPSQAVIDFLGNYSASPSLLTSNPDNLLDYIRSQVSQGELTRWTIAVAGGQATGHKPLSTPFHDVPLVQRKAIAQGDSECELNVLIGPEHEGVGLTRKQIQQALDETTAEYRDEKRNDTPKRPRARVLRRYRSPEEGLLIVYPVAPDLPHGDSNVIRTPVIGFVVVFPESERATKIHYRVNNQYLDELRKALSNEEGEF
ncbi:Z1 domain-containing protein [Nocardiopsis deserti]|uniref:Z1 domain-containing protein n=1 Tax=Nocardiopsis deserti TaxID=2605988 RepID=UPI001239410A|nr:Z1 domain-containing protein [Nocardiopsis deserti]